MKKFFNIFFVILGIIFLLLIVALLYMYMIQFLGVKSVAVPTKLPESNGNGAPAQVVEDKNPMLSPTQEKALETFGVDPASVPSEITPEQEACFVEALGRERVDEIIAGDAPSAIDFFKAKGCVE